VKLIFKQGPVGGHDNWWPMLAWMEKQPMDMGDAIRDEIRMEDEYLEDVMQAQGDGMREAAEGELNKEIARLPLYDVELRLVELMEFGESEDLSTDEREALRGEIARYVAAEVHKVDNIRAYLRHCEEMAKMHASEVERQTRMAQVWTKRSERLKEFCIKALEFAGKKKVQGKTGLLRVQNNGGVRPIEITDESKLPIAYTPLTVIYPPDKDKIRKDLEAGKEIPGARLLERGVHLRVE